MPAKMGFNDNTTARIIFRGNIANYFGGKYLCFLKNNFCYFPLPNYIFLTPEVPLESCFKMESLGCRTILGDMFEVPVLKKIAFKKRVSKNV